MSKIIYIIYRDSLLNNNSIEINKLKTIGINILPTNIKPNPTQIIVNENSLCAIYNPVSTIPVIDKSICMGYSPGREWAMMNKRGESIEGSFAIYRNSTDKFQLVTDMVGSRSIWYYKNQSVFIASSSQRAMVSYLGSFEFNKKIIPWMLSSGTLGPGYSYDNRISLLEPNSMLTLYKNNWTYKKETKRVVLHNKYDSIKEARNNLKSTLINTFNEFELDNFKFVLPLSGGYDSRAILLLLKDRQNLTTITWGTKDALKSKNNDAYISAKLASKYKTKHSYYESYKNNIPLKQSLARFISNSEGRIDHIGGYLDGMEMWKEFFEKGYECILRGDELVGLEVPLNKLDARRSSKITLLSDYYNLSRTFIELFRTQYYPFSYSKDLYKEKGYYALNYEHPIAFAALNDIKLSYVEVFNPLLSASILKTIFSMFNPKYIGNKTSFKNIINELCPDIPIAEKGANFPLNHILSSPEMQEEVLSCLNSWTTKDIIDKEIIDYVTSKYKNKAVIEINKEGIIRRWIPDWAFKIIKKSVSKRELNWGTLGLRLYIIIKMIRIFKDDIKLYPYENSNT